MSKTQIQLTNENESNSIQKSKKSKFNKFFSTVTAVMIASSIAMGPMTLRGEEMSESQKKEVIEKVNKYIETKENELKEKIKENDKKIDEAKKKIDENNKAIEEAKRKEIEAKKQEIEADKELNKLKEKCNTYLSWLVKVKKHCSEKECSVELKNKINDSEKEYNKECSELMASSSR